MDDHSLLSEETISFTFYSKLIAFEITNCELQF